MSSQSATPSVAVSALITQGASFSVLAALSFSHLLNDMMQSLIVAVYPLLKISFSLSFSEVGLITFIYQMTASVLQPLVGIYTDHHPKPYSLPIGMGFTLMGLLSLSFAPNFVCLLVAAALVGIGSSVFHPESSRVAHIASGGRHGMAQSLFQVGGNVGSSLGPLLAALIIVPNGQGSLAWFSLAALIAIFVLIQVSRWYAIQRVVQKNKPTKTRRHSMSLNRNKVLLAIGILLLLIFSKYFYLASINSYLTFYLISKFHISLQNAQVHLFVFLFAVAVGTIIGGPLSDCIGRKAVIWGSLLGSAPFALILPYANLFWTTILTILIGVILASAFSAILVYAQELVPGKVGTVSGFFFGFAFGMGGIGAAALGILADVRNIDFVYHICSFLPLLGIFTLFLPDLENPKRVAM
ncbi:MFS transporter [Candidatus Pandoraea novymonadis]|uniref:Fosmidomycin resistance protein n=1 Tax=Candidatus Pandoraea novymonadis TaxID=1808959 RepID=A0ABX5FG55_9BURK|nr:MFS transporter [Candidatus Pandoraea novymonadis]PSB92428.1 Fosmidomycin resistance protein [Candidatus Pandoraea novymonadis]